MVESISSFASRIATGPRWASVSASLREAASASPGSTTRFTSPKLNAVSASIKSPNRISSLARASPMSRGKRWVPPDPGITPSRTSGMPSRAILAATRRSQHMANSRPPPRAFPSMAAIVGTGRAASRSYIAFSAISFPSPTRPRSAANSLTSDPAQKARSPEPHSTTARTSGSLSTEASASCIAAVTSAEIRFIGGLTSLIVVMTPGSTATRSLIRPPPRNAGAAPWCRW